MQGCGHGRELATAGHPRLEWQLTETLGDSRDESEVFEDVLGREVACEDATANTVLNARPEDLLGEQQAKTVVEQHPVAVVGQMSLRGIEPLMEGQIVLSRTAPFLRGAFGMNERIAHEAPRSSFAPSFST